MYRFVAILLHAVVLCVVRSGAFIDLFNVFMSVAISPSFRLDTTFFIINCQKQYRQALRKPKYDQEFSNVDQCKSACLNQVPQCNTVNYSPYVSSRCSKSPMFLFLVASLNESRLEFITLDRRGKQGKCQFEYCESGYTFGGTKQFNSYIYVGANDEPILPGTWIYLISKRQKPTIKNTVRCPLYFVCAECCGIRCSQGRGSRCATYRRKKLFAQS